MALARYSSKLKALFLRPQATTSLSKTSIKTTPIAEKKHEVLDLDDDWPDDLDMSMGMYRKELIARLAGIKDPFSLGPVRRGDQGTKLDPIRVPSSQPSRLVGCRCEEESHTIIPMWLHQNEPVRCRCGFWMVLYYREPFVEYSWPY